jgi:hypothetical protein
VAGRGFRCQTNQVGFSPIDARASMEWVETHLHFSVIMFHELKLVAIDLFSNIC